MSFGSASSDSFLRCHGGDTFKDDRYTLIETITTGNYATVWKATDAEDNQDTVVAKFARAGSNYDDVWQVESAVLLAMHACPSIISLRDTFSHDAPGGRHTCLVFDYIPSGDLFSWIHDDDAYRTADVDTCKAIAVQIFEGLRALHDTTPGWTVVHADMKPENVLVDTRFRPPKAMIADFGSASVIKGNIDGRRRWVRNCGHTMEYRSPEGVCGANLGTKSDIWSAGVILYELFTGCSLFDPPCHRHEEYSDEGSGEGSDEGSDDEQDGGGGPDGDEEEDGDEDGDEEEDGGEEEEDDDADEYDPGSGSDSCASWESDDDVTNVQQLLVMREALGAIPRAVARRYPDMFTKNGSIRHHLLMRGIPSDLADAEPGSYPLAEQLDADTETLGPEEQADLVALLTQIFKYSPNPRPDAAAVLAAPFLR